MKNKVTRNIALGITLAIVTALIAVSAIWLKQYYNNRYVLDDYFYTVIPLDYDITPTGLVNSSGQLMDYEKEYDLLCFNAQGEEKRLKFRAMMRFQELYPGGTYIRVAASKTAVLHQSALAEADVPKLALKGIKAEYKVGSPDSLAEYADVRTKQLRVMSTLATSVSCIAEGKTLKYSFTFKDTDMAENQSVLLDYVFRAQFRTDVDTFKELQAIILEVKTKDGSTVFTQKYNERITFGYDQG